MTNNENYNDNDQHNNPEHQTILTNTVTSELTSLSVTVIETNVEYEGLRLDSRPKIQLGRTT